MNPDFLCRFLLWSLGINYAILLTWFVVFVAARNWLRARIGANESVVLLAETDGNAVGFTQLYPMYSSVQTARIWVLNDLYVPPDQRRHGVAKALLKAAIEYARNDGASRLQLETGRRNEAARALYRNAGWQEDDTQWYSVPLN